MPMPANGLRARSEEGLGSFFLLNPRDNGIGRGIAANASRFSRFWQFLQLSDARFMMKEAVHGSLDVEHMPMSGGRDIRLGNTGRFGK